MECRLTLFGPPRLLDDKGGLISVPQKTYALVAYIVLANRGEPATRAALRQFLWEDSDTKAAATNMRKFLSRLVDRQKERGFELIRSRRDHVELAPSAKIDLVEFQRLVASPSPKDIGALCNLYRGDLLEGFDWEEAEFRSWLQQQQSKQRDAFVGAVVAQLEPPSSALDTVQARVVARQLLEVDPYNEVAHRALMRLFADEGEPARVQTLYVSLRQRLRDELKVEPDAATTQLLESLLPTYVVTRRGAARSEPQPLTASTLADAAMHGVGHNAAEQAANSTRSGRAGAPKVTILPPPPIAGQDYPHQIAVSLIEDVTIGICRYRTLSVVAPHTASQLDAGDRKALFHVFGIGYAVETQLQNRGGELWLVVRLVNAASREILWTEHYAFDQELAARHYRDLSIRILTSVVDRIERAELTAYESEQNASAYHLYLGGQRHLRVFDLPGVRRARRAFKSALSGCPDFVPALSSLAKTYHLEWLLLARGESELLKEAERLAKVSVEIDPDDARGYRELGVCNLYTGRFDESLEAFAQAEERNPRFADLLMDYSDALTHACQPTAALSKINTAIELNPLCPDSYWWAAGGANFYLERYADAVESVSRMRDQSPAYRLMAASWAMLGDREQANKFVRKTKDIHPEFRVSDWLAILPIRDQDFKKRYEHSLREAGFE